MASSKRLRAVGILTSGGDCPGLNAVIRAIAKSLLAEDVQVFGIMSGFTGLVENRYRILDDEHTSGLLTQGGTMLLTSRNKPHKMPTPDGGTRDMTGAAIETYRRLNLDCLFCLGGGGTQKNAYRLLREGGINVITCPKTIDNDVWGTDACFGFDTGMCIATEALDRLHTTASSHHRVIVCDIMGHNAGWLALGAGLAGGADVILIPEIPYDIDVVTGSLMARRKRGKMFSIVAVAEGALSREQAKQREDASQEETGKKKKKKNVEEHSKEPVAAILAEHIEDRIGLETRVTSLGYLQRGGIPTPTDRALCTAFGATAAELALKGTFGVMVAKRGEDFVPVPLEDVVKKLRLVPLDHPWIHSARDVGTCLGDEIPKGYR